MPKTHARAFVSGLVQGVYFRDSTRRVADAHGVTGWVRNLPNGRVEALLEGEETAVRAVVDWLHRGPPHAEVEQVDVEFGEYTGAFDRFAVR